MIRSHEETDDAGEGYFASISDLMVGILFIFLLMLTVFAINYANESVESLKAKIAQLEFEKTQMLDAISKLAREFDDVNGGLRGERGRLEGVRKDLLFQLQSRLESRGVRVEVEADQGILRLSSEGLFELNEAKFTLKGQENARALLEEMAQLLPCYAKASPAVDGCTVQQPIFETVLIEGHTDTLATQRPGGNWTLSTDRARAFMELMGNSAAVSLRDLRNSNGQTLLGLAGYGDSRPRAGVPGEDPGNRRIETRFLLAAQQAGVDDRLRRLDEAIAILKRLGSPAP